MNESISTTGKHEHDTAFFGITDRLAADTALWPTAALAGEDVETQLEKVLQDVIAAESWEAMAVRAGTGYGPPARDLVVVPARCR
jgi:hypothetical protein